ncbi:MAG: hypothetical protein ACRD5G_15670 [Candidatus Acidiferrales bacterium]
MAEETLVKEVLSREMIEAGRELARAMRERQVELSACFWLYSAERNEWQLTLALPLVDTQGPLKAYEIVQSILRPLEPVHTQSHPFRSRLQLSDVSVLGATRPLVRSIQDTPLDEDGARFRGRLGDSFFDDIYVYNLDRIG